MKTIRLVVLFLLLIPMAVAQPKLTITPTSVDIFLIKGEEKQFIIYLDTINSTQDIFNISFSDTPHLEFEPINNMSINSSLEYYYFAYTDDLIDNDYSSTVSFDYYTEITLEPSSHNITVDADGFHPSSLTINKGDKIYVKNTDTINHTFTKTDYGFNELVQPGQAIEKTLDDIGTLLFFDTVSNLGGQVEVKTNIVSILTHSADYDKVINFHVDSSLEPTTISITMFEQNFSIKHNESKQSALQLTNDGDETAFNIRLDMQWTTFTLNNFDLNQSQSKVVVFDIKPSIGDTNQSDKTHNLTMTIQGDNTNKLEEPFNIYIPYTSFISFGNITDLAEIWREKMRFCDKYPLSMECAMQPIIKTENITIYKDKPVNVTFTEDEVVAIKDMLVGEDMRTRIENIVKIAMSDIQADISGIQAGVDNLSTEVDTLTNISEDNSVRMKRREVSGVITTILFVLGVIIIVGGAIVFVVMKRNKQRELRMMAF